MAAACTPHVMPGGGAASRQLHCDRTWRLARHYGVMADVHAVIDHSIQSLYSDPRECAGLFDEIEPTVQASPDWSGAPTAVSAAQPPAGRTCPRSGSRLVVADRQIGRGVRPPIGT
jgi:hypothetical protein